MAHNINVRVNTDPMAKEIERVSSGVTRTTVAVGAMQAAVIKTEIDTTNRVCSNLNKGFYMLIQSQLSQKMARLQSDVDSHIMQLNQQKKALLNIQNRMERDYNNIARRYGKLFSGLNQNLYIRVFAIDKPVMLFATSEVEKVENRTKLLTANVPISQLESLTLSQKMLISNMKMSGNRLIGSMHSFLYDLYEQEKQTNRLLIEDRYNRAKEGVHHIPVLILEQIDGEGARPRVKWHYPKMNLPQHSSNKLEREVRERYEKVECRKDFDKENLHNPFYELVDDSQLDDRVKKMAKALFDRSEIRTF